MERNYKINPIGLKGNEINERMKELMGVKPIMENNNRSAVELTKLGPDGKSYAIIRENREYYIKTSDKTSNLCVEDFKYIGGLQNKKQEAYPNYSNAVKHLNIKFNSLCEAFDVHNNYEFFVDDNLIGEHHPLSADKALSATKGIGDPKEYIVDKAGKELSSDAKEGSEKDGFGDNLAGKKAIDDMEEVSLTEDEKAIDDMLNENYLDEYETQYMEEPSDVASEGLTVLVDMAKKAGVSLEKFIDLIADKLHGGEGLNTGTRMYEEDMNMEPSNDEIFDRLDNMSASELIGLLGDAGKDVLQFAKTKLNSGMDMARDYFGGETNEEEMTLEQIQEGIDELKKKN